MSAKLPFDFKKWTVDQVVQYLEQQKLGQWAEKFKEKNITGDQLQALTDTNLKDMGIEEPNDRERILLCIRKLIQGKVFNDPIHGHMELHPLLVKIIDTPQFQRLRNIKQLGGAYFVYPGASHNRFEHSIGVAHLAGQLGQTLKTNQLDLNITDRDILCVQIAGLCHDLGHGPFSHLFDAMFIPKADTVKNKEWKHETASLKMFDHLVEDNKLEDVMKQYGLNMSEDLDFIKKMIDRDQWLHMQTAHAKDHPEDHAEDHLKDLREDKPFLYEIVSNKTTGIDVDKFDYFARDCYHLGIPNNFDHRRFLMFARVCEVKGQKHICSRDKEQHNLYDMFHTRYGIHRRACQHKVNNIIQCMITDAFLKADKHIHKIMEEDENFTLSGSIDDMVAYTKLTDTVFDQILNSTSKELKDARDILHRIITRDLYRFLGEEMVTVKPTEEWQPMQMTSKWKEELTQNLPEGLTKEDFEVMPIEMNYGMKDKNPIDEMYFYSKSDMNTAKKMPKDQVGIFLPVKFSEKLIRFFCKKTDEKSLKAAKEHFDNWIKENGFSVPQDGDTGAQP